MPSIFAKASGDVLDYKFDFANTTNGGTKADWLASGETISTYAITVDAGITVDSDSKTDSNTSITVWLSGGSPNAEYYIECAIVTSAARTKTRRIKIEMLPY